MHVQGLQRDISLFYAHLGGAGRGQRDRVLAALQLRLRPEVRPDCPVAVIWLMAMRQTHHCMFLLGRLPSLLLSILPLIQHFYSATVRLNSLKRGVDIWPHMPVLGSGVALAVN